MAFSPDEILADLATRLRSPFLDALMVDFTALGELAILLPITVFAAGWLILRGSPREGLWFTVCMLTADIGVRLAKRIIGRVRPAEPHPLLCRVPVDYSFPSGHATMAVVVYVGLALLVANRVESTRQKRYLVGCAGCLAAWIGVTRVYLGVHHGTDVLGGWAVGLAWLFVWRRAFKPHDAKVSI